MAPAIAAEVSSWIQLYRPYELSNAPIPLLSVRLCARSDLKGSLDFLRSAQKLRSAGFSDAQYVRLSVEQQEKRVDSNLTHVCQGETT